MSQNGREVVIVEAARTPIGRGQQEKGYYRDTHPNELLGAAYRAVIERAGVEPGQVENVIAGCVAQFGPQGLHVGRNAWLQQGFPIETSATTIDLQCGSAQQAVNLAASQVASGVHDVVIGGGVEHMGKLPFAATMKTVFKEDGGITAGNSSQISDGAAAVLLMSAEKAKELGLTARARIMDQTTVGCDPVKMLEGPIPATAKLLERNSMSIDDIDLVEINEAFAPVVAAWRRKLQP